MKKALKISGMAVGCCLLLAAGSMLAYSRFFPVVPSPPLVTTRGISLNDETRAKLTEIVFQAAREDDVQTVDEFLKEGFTPNVRSPRGDTLLTVAAYSGSAGVVERLLQQADVEIEARNRMGLTAVSAAAFKGHNEILKLLVAHGADVNAANSMHQTPLMFAALSGRTQSVEVLLTAGAKPETEDSLGNSALSLARTQGADEVVALLSVEGD